MVVKWNFNRNSINTQSTLVPAHPHADELRCYNARVSQSILIDEFRWAVGRMRRHWRRQLPPVLVAAVGIAVAASGFSVTYSLLWRPLPFSDSTHVAVVAEPLDVHRRLTTADLDAERARLDASPLVLSQAHFASGGAFQRADASRGESGLVQYQVTPAFFRLLGTAPLLGRVLDAHDEVDEPTPGVLSYETWRSRFGADPGVLGDVVSVGPHRLQVVGVMPPAFAYPAGTTLWTPLHWTYARPPAFEPWLVRLRPEATVAQLAAVFPRLDVRAIADVVRPHEQLPVALLFAGALLVALVAAVQTMALQAAAVMSSVQDAAIKRALGADRRRVLIGFALDAALSAALTVPLAWLIVPMMSVWIGRQLPPEVLGGQSVVADSSAFLFACLIAIGIVVATTVVVGRIAAREPFESRGLSTVTTAPWLRRLMFRLVSAQVCCTTILLYMTGVAVHSLARFSHADLGFNAAQTLAVEVPDIVSLDLGPERATRLEEARQRLAQAPGIAAVARSLRFPLSHKLDLRGTAKLVGDPTGTAVSARVNFISPEFTDVLQMPLVAGAPFSDRADTKVALVNETLAKQLAPGGHVLGQWLQVTANRGRIVGVVRDFVDTAANLPSDPEAFFPEPRDTGFATVLLVRFDANVGDPSAVVNTALSSVSTSIPRITPLRVYAAATSAPYRGRTLVLEWMALVALGLAAGGLSAALMLSVKRQTREIAVRLALGADRRRIRLLVIGQMAAQMGLGATAGLLGGIAAARLIRGALFQVEPLDPTTVLGVLGITLAIAALAACLPAERAARLDPAGVLKES